MQITKLSKNFSKNVNHIANYFVTNDGRNPPKIWNFPFFVNSETFRQQLNRQITKKDSSEQIFTGRITHFCYDVSGNRLYFPEVSSIAEIERTKRSQECSMIETLI